MLFPEKFELTESLKTQLNAESHECHFRSAFNFLKAHNGIRKNKLHLLIAPTHSGKSTVARSIIRDIIFNNRDKKVLLWLTEETKKEFMIEFSETVPVCDRLNNLTLVSEMQFSDINENNCRESFEEIVDQYSFDILIVDNITTSVMYMDKTISTQSEVAQWYKSLTKKFAVFLIAHTNTNNYNDRLLDETDIRGSKTITNISEFLYILQPISVGDVLRQFILIKKHRGQIVENKFYSLNYNKHIKAIESDNIANFEKLKEVFKLRNKLNGK